MATIPIVLLLPALFAPLLAADAARPGGTPTITLRGSLYPGAAIKVGGSGFSPSADAAILWDTSLVISDVRTNRKGSFAATATIPPDASAGRHAIAVAYAPVLPDTRPVVSVELALQTQGTDASATPTEIIATGAPTQGPVPTMGPTELTPTPGVTPDTDPTAGSGPTWSATPTGGTVVPPSTTEDPTPQPTLGPTPYPTQDPTPRPTLNPTPSPTATPKPTPTPTPKPTATPAPTPTPTSPPTVSGPFAPPTTTGVFQVPASIDATGGSDASGALNAFIKSVPNGSVISFPGSGIYRLNQGLLLAGRSNIVLDGNGATLRIRGSGSDEALSAFLLRGSRHVAIKDFRVAGADPNWPANSGENAHVLGLSGWYGGGPSSYVEMTNVRASHIFGDGVYIEGRNSGAYEPSSHIWVHDNTFDYMGRNGVSLINATNVLIESNVFNHISYHVVDIEPNFAAQDVRDFTFRRNDVGSYAHRTNLLGFFVSDVAIGTGVGSNVSGVVIADNRVAGIAADGYEGRPRALNSKFISTGGTRHSDIVFRGNTTTRAVAGPAVLYFSGIDGVRVTGNVQPLLSSSLVAFSNCTGVSYP